jgi:hypothetical protein
MSDVDIRDVIFWIFLIFSVGLLVWNVFGNSPTEFLALVAILFTIFLKTWQISDRQIKSDMRFGMLARDFKSLSGDFKEHLRNYDNHLKDHNQQV